MIITYYIYDNEGKYLYSNALESQPINSTIQPIKNKTDVWNGTEWLDSRTADEQNAEIYKNYSQVIGGLFTVLCQKTLAFSIGKPYDLGVDYLREQADRYKYKYEVANGTITDEMAEQMIADESKDFGITAEQMKGMIIQRFEMGQKAYISTCSIMERARTKALTFIENGEVKKADSCIELMQNLEVFSQETIGKFITDILSL